MGGFLEGRTVARGSLGRRVIGDTLRPGALARDRRGVIAVETALVFSLLFLPLFLGGADVAMLMKTQMQLEAAVRNAVFFAYSSPPHAIDAAGIENAAVEGYGGVGPPVSVAGPTYAYYCIAPTGTEASGTEVDTATAACPAGQSVATWVSVSVAATVELPVSIAPFPSAVPLKAGATVRVD